MCEDLYLFTSLLYLFIHFLIISPKLTSVIHFSLELIFSHSLNLSDSISLFLSHYFTNSFKRSHSFFSHQLIPRQSVCLFDRSVLSVYLSSVLCVCMSVRLSYCLSVWLVCLSVLSICLSCLSICLSSVYMCVCTSVGLSGLFACRVNKSF